MHIDTRNKQPADPNTPPCRGVFHAPSTPTGEKQQMTMMPHNDRWTPAQLAARLGVATRKVHSWIRAGELRAVNIATDPNGRPRWVIDMADLQAFEQRRATSA